MTVRKLQKLLAKADPRSEVLIVNDKYQTAYTVWSASPYTVGDDPEPEYFDRNKGKKLFILTT
jgi:hypothetical protein